MALPDWDADSPQLNANLRRVLRGIRDAAWRRDRPGLAWARAWQAETMRGLRVPREVYVGRFRGEPGLGKVEVSIGRKRGVRAAAVAAELAAFEDELRRRVRNLDTQLAPGAEPTARQILDVLDLCAWAHAEWVRIHPFANGNGRTARLWANALAMRYGLPPFVRLRPRPDGGYGAAGRAAMDGDWQPTARGFRRMLIDALSGA